MNAVATQPFVFLACLAAGLVSGVIYRLLGLWSARQPSRWVRGACDVLFVVSSGVLFFVALLWTNDGSVRLYTVLAFLGGYALLCGITALPRRHRSRQRPQH